MGEPTKTQMYAVRVIAQVCGEPVAVQPYTSWRSLSVVVGARLASGDEVGLEGERAPVGQGGGHHAPPG
jgi:hypothetical protein